MIRDIKFILVYEPMMKGWIQLTALILTDSVLGHRTNQLGGNRTALKQVCFRSGWRMSSLISAMPLKILVHLIYLTDW